MNKIKVIDLLNKIANGEEIPKKIKLNGSIFEYQGDDYLFTDKDNTDYWLFSEPYSDKSDFLDIFLKTEIEIIEEDKKIEKLESYISCGWHGTCEDLNREDLFNDLSKIGNKINEIIDKLNEGDKK